MPEALTRILIPIDVSDSTSRSDIDTQIVQSSEVVLLGYWPIPDQSAPSQIRNQFEEEAQQRLEAVASRLTDEGVTVQTRLVFTNDTNQSIDGAANKYECESILLPGTTSPPSETRRGLVLVKPNADLDRIVTTLGALFADSDIELLLFHAATNDNERLYDAIAYMLRGLADRLTELGIDPDRIEWEQSFKGERLDVVLSRVSDFDFVVLGETEPSVRERVFGSVQKTLAEETAKPQLTIRSGV